jgi:hypothetical protein
MAELGTTAALPRAKSAIAGIRNGRDRTTLVWTLSRVLDRGIVDFSRVIADG